MAELIIRFEDGSGFVFPMDDEVMSSFFVNVSGLGYPYTNHHEIDVEAY